MAVIGIGGSKGGAAKTTTAVNLAAALAVKGGTVGLLDSDAAPMSAEWHAIRVKNGNKPEISIRRSTGDIGHLIMGMKSEFDHVIIDCGGFDGPEMRWASGKSDIFISPFMPSYFDLKTAARVNEIIGMAMPINPTLKAYTLICGASTTKNSKANTYAEDTLRDLEYLNLLETKLSYREVWRNTARDGRGVIESKSKQAIDEINMLLEELGL